MTSAQRCDATSPRTRNCTAELMERELRSMPGDSAHLAKAIRESPDVDADEARAIHKMFCVGEHDENAFPDAVVACWKATSCDALAACVWDRIGASDAKLPREP